MQFPLIPSLWFALLLGVVPGLLILAVTIRSKHDVLATILGALGWFVALQLRLPLLQFLNTLTWLPNPLILIGVSAALLAGVFEEGIRYFIVTKKQSITASKRSLVSFGIGWGVCEAILLFGLVIINTIFIIQATDPILASTIVSLIGVSLGAVERNIAISFHLALTIIIVASLEKRTYFPIAIFFHFFIDLALVLGLLVFALDAFLLEAVFAAITFFVCGYALDIWQRKLKNTWKRSHLDDSQ